MKFKHKLSKISSLHYGKLVFRSVLLLAGLIYYVMGRRGNVQEPIAEVLKLPFLEAFIWVVFTVEMVLRFFPSKWESMGCQKQFLRNYRPAAGQIQVRQTSTGSIIAIAAAWIAANGIFGGMYYAGWIDDGILFLLCLFYSVCDMICILFFCPFQAWFMKNKCCSSCRIYNWDYAMMFTPLVFMRDKDVYSWCLLACALALFVRWEIVAWRHPERFSAANNEALACSNCQEKLCQHKKHLHYFWAKNKALFRTFRNR
jgi:hypothetical protein